MARIDDDALSWEGDDDPTLDAGAPEPQPEAVAAAPLPEGWTAVGKGSDAVPAVASEPAVASASVVDADEEAAPLGNATLIALGILAGVYLLYAIGWLVGGLRLSGLANFLVTDAVYTVALILAVLTPFIWFAATLVATARRAAWLRFVWLVAGIVLLVPWPFIMVGAVGQ